LIVYIEKIFQKEASLKKTYELPTLAGMLFIELFKDAANNDYAHHVVVFNNRAMVISGNIGSYMPDTITKIDLDGMYYVVKNLHSKTELLIIIHLVEKASKR